MTKQICAPKAHVYRPDITFEDTNLVGNVYFANYVRWQNDCRDQWLKETDPAAYADVFHGNRRICVTELSLDFSDPVGAMLGDTLEIGMDIERLGSDSCIASSSTRRICDSGPESENSVLATGRQRFEIGSPDDEPTECDHESGPETDRAYRMVFPVPMDACVRHGRLGVLDMIRWQGKCRERFLEHHAPGALRLIADRTLTLHTSRLGFRRLLDVRVMPTDNILLEMRLGHLRGGRLAVNFNYFVSDRVDGSGGQRRVATGSQALCCKRLSGRGLAPAVFPADMLQAFRQFTTSAKLLANIDDAIEFATNNGVWNTPDRGESGTRRCQQANH